MINFERIVPVVNPGSTNVDRAWKDLEEIQAAYPKQYDPQLRPIETSPDADETTERIDGVIREGDLVVALVGDGMLRSIARSTSRHDDVATLILHAGNGYDAARDLNGEYGSQSVLDILRSGEAAAVHPIDIAADSLRLQAVNYFEIGSSARGARLLNNDTWRRLPLYGNNRVRLAYEFAALPPTAFLSRSFSFENPNKMQHQAVNLSFLNAATQAKLAKIPTHLAEPELFMTDVGGRFGLLPWALDSLIGVQKGEYLKKGEERSLRNIGRTVLAHTDAEPFVIEKGSDVTVRVADVPFYAVSTRHLTGQ